MILHRFSFLQDIIPSKSLLSITRKKIYLPFYHCISDIPLSHISNLYDLKSVQQFEKDLDYLCKFFKPISLDDLKDSIYREKKFTKPHFLLSFDDGLKEVYTNIAPILKRKGIPAVFFVNSKFLDNEDLFFRYKVSLIIEEIKNNQGLIKSIIPVLKPRREDLLSIVRFLLNLGYQEQGMINQIAKLLEIDFTSYLNKVRPYLQTYQVKELLDDGFHFGSHSIDHPLFNEMEFEVQKNQISESFNILERKFQLSSRYFAFPFTDEGIKKELFKWMFFNYRCDLSFGTAGLKDDEYTYHQHRIPFDGNLRSAKDIIKGECLYFVLKSIFNKNKIKRI